MHYTSKGIIVLPNIRQHATRINTWSPCAQSSSTSVQHPPVNIMVIDAIDYLENKFSKSCKVRTIDDLENSIFGFAPETARAKTCSLLPSICRGKNENRVFQIVYCGHRTVGRIVHEKARHVAGDRKLPCDVNVPDE